MFFRFKGSRFALAVVTATAFFAIAGGATATPTVVIGSGPYVIAHGTYWSSVTLTCPTGGTACAGLLTLETAYAIKPYPSRPKAKARVADVAYSVPAGASRTIKARIYGPALAQALKAHAVTLRLITWDTNTNTPTNSRIATFILTRR